MDSRRNLVAADEGVSSAVVVKSYRMLPTLPVNGRPHLFGNVFSPRDIEVHKGDAQQGWILPKGEEGRTLLAFISWQPHGIPTWEFGLTGTPWGT